jgi:hypothetical protein
VLDVAALLEPLELLTSGLGRATERANDEVGPDADAAEDGDGKVVMTDGGRAQRQRPTLGDFTRGDGDTATDAQPTDCLCGSDDALAGVESQPC